MNASARTPQRVVLVTGASSGIGAAVCRTLARAGWHVVGCARRADRLEALRAEIEAAGGTARVYPADVRRESELLGVFGAIDRDLGRLDALVNNAGLGRDAPLVDGATEAWREMLEVNVLALCIATREAVRRMQAEDTAGHVVHISSMAAHRVPGGSGVYAATKHAVRALTEGLRLELRAAESPIRVSAISPGFVQTEFAEVYHGDPERAAETYARYEVLTADDVAEAVRYVLCQPAHVQVHDVLMRPTDQPN